LARIDKPGERFPDSLNEANLSDADLRGAQLGRRINHTKRGRFFIVNLDLAGANLEEADLRGVKLVGTQKIADPLKEFASRRWETGVWLRW